MAAPSRLATCHIASRRDPLRETMAPLVARFKVRLAPRGRVSLRACPFVLLPLR